MNGEPMKPGPGDEDSWESLAENLFGIDFGRHEDADELISPEELLPEEPHDLARDESTGEGRAGELAEEADAPEAPHPPRRDDEQEYWDILREWAGDVAQPSGEERHWSPVKGKRKKRERRSSAEAPPRREESAAPARAGRDEEEYVEDTGFGAGLVEHESRPRRSRPEPVVAADVEDEEPAEIQEKRATEEPSEEEGRSRRRRRGRRPRREGPVPSPRSRESAAEDDFTPPEEERAGDREGEDESDRPPRRGRRRRREFDREEAAIERTAEKPPDEEEEVLVDWSAEPILDSASSAEAEDEEEDEERETVATYRSIPTWEEAIACLLNPGAASSRTEERRDRGSGRESGRRHRRRR